MPPSGSRSPAVTPAAAVGWGGLQVLPRSVLRVRGDDGPHHRDVAAVLAAEKGHPGVIGKGHDLGLAVGGVAVLAVVGDGAPVAPGFASVVGPHQGGDVEGDRHVVLVQVAVDGSHQGAVRFFKGHAPQVHGGSQRHRVLNLGLLPGLSPDHRNRSPAGASGSGVRRPTSTPSSRAPAP